MLDVKMYSQVQNGKQFSYYLIVVPRNFYCLVGAFALSVHLRYVECG